MVDNTCWFSQKQKLQVLSATSGRSRFDEPERNIERNYVVFKVHWRQIQAMICFFFMKNVVVCLLGVYRPPRECSLKWNI